MPRVKTKGMVSSDARARVQQRFANKFFDVGLDAGHFYAKFPSADERQAFADLYPAWYFKMFHVERNTFEHLASYRPDIFSRWHACEYFQLHQPLVPFVAPDLREIPHAERRAVLVHARARFWTAARLPLLAVEAQWLRVNVPELLTDARQCPADDGSWDQQCEPFTPEGDFR